MEITETRRDKTIRSLNALLEVSKAMGAQMDLDELLPVIVHRASEVMEADRSSLFVYDEESDMLWSRVAEGLEKKEIRFALGMGIAGDVARTRKAANVADVRQDPRFNPEFDRRFGYHSRSTLCMPIANTQGKLLGVIQAINKIGRDRFDAEDESVMEALASHIAVALERAQLVDAFVEKQKLEETLTVASQIQMKMLRRTFPPYPQHPEFEIFAHLTPARHVGGDFYDFALRDDELYFVVGDVSGKGIPAALLMAVTKTLFKANAANLSTAPEVVAAVNHGLHGDIDPAMFVTAFCGHLNIRSGELRYCNAGHNPPLRILKDGSLESLSEAGGIALGVVQDWKYELASVRLENGESVYVCTDGVTEAMDLQEREFSDTRLEQHLAGTRGRGARQIVEGTIEAVRAHAGSAPQWDDMTALCLRYLGGL